MRMLFAVLLTGLATALLSAEGTDAKVEVKGPHICCKRCATVVGDILGKVAGVSQVSADIKTKTVTFTAKDEKAASAGFKALVDGGFFGSATAGGKEVKADVPALKKGTKADVITVKDVHVCCNACEKAINKVFKDAAVTFEGSGAQRTVRIEGNGLDGADVMATLHKTGFNGTIAK